MTNQTESAQESLRAQIEDQASYYARRQPVRMVAADTPYVQRHFAEAVRAVALRRDDRVCEWGAGMGRFSRLLAEYTSSLTAVELSPELAAVCRSTLSSYQKAQVEVGDILDVTQRVDRSFSVVAGFFMLHHLADVAPYFRAATRILEPGGRLVFVEPNPLNPLYAVQITCTPGMRWREERGVYNMWAARIRRAAESTGFSEFKVHRYGALPRLPYNLAARFGAERWPEYLIPPSLRAFQVFTATLRRGTHALR